MWPSQADYPILAEALRRAVERGEELGGPGL